MAAVPGLRGKLKRGQHFQLVGLAGPAIEEIASPSFGGDFHVRRSLPVGVAVEAGVASDGVQQRAGSKLIGVRNAEGGSVSSVVRGCALRDQGVDVGELQRQGEDIYI